MENQNQQQSIFGLNVDSNISAHLAEAAKWGRFLAIVGFVVCGLIVIGGIFLAFTFSRLSSEFSDYPGYRGGGFGSGFGAGMAIMYILIAVLYFFPCLFLLRFSNAMKLAIANNDQNQLNESAKNLKVMFRYVGILTIIFLSLYVLALLLGGLGAALG